MSAHTCTTLTEGCFRCELHRDEIAAAHEEVLADAEKAWQKWLNTPQADRPQSFYSTEDVFKAGFMAGAVA